MGKTLDNVIGIAGSIMVLTSLPYVSISIPASSASDGTAFVEGYARSKLPAREENPLANAVALIGVAGMFYYGVRKITHQ